MLEPFACVVGAAEMRKTNELDAHRDEVTRLRMQCPIGPFDGLLVSARSQMSKGEPGREQKGEWIERAQPYRLLLPYRPLFRRARMIAAQRDTSVSALVKRFLLELGAGESETERLKRQERELRERITDFDASDRLSRDDVHRRGI